MNVAVVVVIDSCRSLPPAELIAVGKTPSEQPTVNLLPPVRVPSESDGKVCVEVWAAPAADAAFVEFVGMCDLDCSGWRAEHRGERWYKLDHPRIHKRRDAWAGREGALTSFWEDASELDGDTTYVQLVATFARPSADVPAKTPPVQSHGVAEEHGFQFVMPHKPVRQRALLRRLIVREVREQTQTGVLDELLPTTLYGKLPDQAVEASRNDGLCQALKLLQLSCQYALHATTELERYNRSLEQKAHRCQRRINRLRRRHTRIGERRCNLERERDVLSCALDGMEIMVDEFQTEEASLSSPPE